MVSSSNTSGASLAADAPSAFASTATSTVSSRRSSFSSSGVGGAPVPSTAQTKRMVHTNDPLSRTYAKPEGEINLAEALAREPQRWSLAHWTKNARDVPAPKAPSPGRFEMMKAELRRAQQQMNSK